MAISQYKYAAKVAIRLLLRVAFLQSMGPPKEPSLCVCYRLRMGSGRHYEDQEFDGPGDVELELRGAMATACEFRHYDLSGASLRGTHLTECTFRGCDLSTADLTDALLHSVRFEGCRLAGVDFGTLRRDAVGLVAEFDDCDLTLASFRGIDLRGCAFRGSKMEEAEFVDCDMRGIEVTECEMRLTRFRGTDLRNADLRGSSEYQISPYENNVRGMQVNVPEAIGLLVGLGVRLRG